MSKTVKWILVGLLGIGGIALGIYIYKQISLLKDYCYTTMGAIIDKISFNKIKFTLLFSVKNKSDVDITITDQNYLVYVNGMLVSKVYRETKNEILANGKSVFKLDVEFNPQDLLRAGLTNIQSLLSDKSKMEIELKGSLGIKSGIFKLRKFPIYEKMTLNELMSESAEEKEEC